MTTSTLVGPLLQNFFTDHLMAQRHLSLQTVASYRDTFRLLLQFIHRKTGIEPAALRVPDLDGEIILSCLDGLEKDRSNSIVSRNLRLTAIRSFYRMVALRDPASVGIATRVLAIPMKRAHTRVREYLTREEIEAILASLDRSCWYGRRDYALRLDVGAALARTGPLDWIEEGPGGETRVVAEPAVLGDVVLARKEIATSYHLAVSVDDALQGVSLVTRGADLFAATHIHRPLQALLNLPAPRYRHHPLVTDATGRRLAKRDGAQAVRAEKQGAGV